MNLTKEPQKKDLIELLAKCDDLQGHHQLLVYNDGQVKIVILPTQGSKEEFYKDVKFSLEIWIKGNNYTGKDASQREWWVDRIFEAVNQNWKNNSKGIISIF